MTDMKAMLEEYRQAYSKLEKRHEELIAQRLQYDKRVLLLEEEMDEMAEAMRLMRSYAEGT